MDNTQMLYKEIPYRVSPAANAHLLSLFEHMHRNTINRRANSAVTYNGTVMVNTEPNRNPHGVSHALNVLATHTDLSDWQDARTQGQRRRCDEQLTHPTFTTARQLLQYTREYGQLKYATIWSDEPICDTDQDGTVLSKQNHIQLHLSPSAIQFYKSLAIHHKMAPLLPPRSYSASTSNHVSATLEAIGSSWLNPPSNYYDLITDPSNRNTNMIHQLDRSGAVYAATGKRRLYGNHSHEPYVHKPLSTYKHDLTNLQMNPDLIYDGLTDEQITAIQALTNQAQEPSDADR